jgi:hypothetical protein
MEEEIQSSASFAEPTCPDSGHSKEMPLLRPEHHVAFVGLLLVHVAARWVLGQRIPARYAHAVIWTGVTGGMALAWTWLFWEAFPWGRITPSTVLHVTQAQHLFTLYLESLAVLLVYYAFTASLASAHCTWYWILTHIFLLPAVSGLVLLAPGVRGPSFVVRCISMWLRYQQWLAMDSLIALQMRLDPNVPAKDDNAITSWWWFLLYRAAWAHSMYQLNAWFSDHWDLIDKGGRVLVHWGMAMVAAKGQ